MSNEVEYIDGDNEEVLSTVPFKDLNGKSKYLQPKNGQFVHTGNANYVRISNGSVEYHPTAKILKRTMHKIRKF